MAVDDPVQLPSGWDVQELLQTAQTFTPPGADSDIPANDRFRAGVTKLVALRTLLDEVENKLAVFLLGDGYQKLEQPWQREPMLDNGLSSLGGKAWVVNAPVVSGFCRDIDGETDADAFEFVIETLLLGDRPAIVFDPRVATPSLRFYPEGIVNADRYELLRSSPSTVTIEDILIEVEKIHEQHLITPEAQSDAGKLWKNSAKWWPATNAEKVAQLYLKVGLSRAFPSCTVREEQTQVTGRIDLEIEEKVSASPILFKRHAVLELKILRSFGATGKAYTDDFTLEWVKKGVEQAYSYRMERDATSSALCCFDMRTSDSADDCFDHVVEMGAKHAVVLRRWYVYSSSELYRSAMSSANMN